MTVQGRCFPASLADSIMADYTSRADCLGSNLQGLISPSRIETDSAGSFLRSAQTSQFLSRAHRQSTARAATSSLFRSSTSAICPDPPINLLSRLQRDPARPALYQGSAWLRVVKRADDLNCSDMRVTMGTVWPAVSSWLCFCRWMARNSASAELTSRISALAINYSADESWFKQSALSLLMIDCLSSLPSTYACYTFCTACRARQDGAVPCLASSAYWQKASWEGVQLGCTIAKRMSSNVKSLTLSLTNQKINPCIESIAPSTLRKSRWEPIPLNWGALVILWHQCWMIGLQGYSLCRKVSKLISRKGSSTASRNSFELAVVWMMHSWTDEGSCPANSIMLEHIAMLSSTYSGSLQSPSARVTTCCHWDDSSTSSRSQNQKGQALTIPQPACSATWDCHSRILSALVCSSWPQFLASAESRRVSWRCVIVWICASVQRRRFLFRGFCMARGSGRKAVAERSLRSGKQRCSASSREAWLGLNLSDQSQFWMSFLCWRKVQVCPLGM